MGELLGVADGGHGVSRCRSIGDPRGRRQARPGAAETGRNPGSVSLAPALEQRQRVDRLAAAAPAADPDLEVKVGPGGAAGASYLADRLAGAHAIALRHRGRAGPQVHEDVVVVLVVPVHDHVVTGPAGLVLDGLDDTAARRHEGRALRGGEILPLVAVALPPSTEARVLAAPAEAARDGKGVVGELEVRRAAGGRCA